MPFIPVTACVQARLNYREDNGVLAQQVFYHATTGVPLMSELEAIGAAWSELFVEGLATSMTSNWQLDSVSLRAMNEEEGLQLIEMDGMPISGISAGSPTPDQVSGTVTWSTGLAGRTARGRTYFVGLPMENIVNRNRLSDGGRTDLQNGWGVVREGFETIGHALQVVSFQDNLIPRTEGRALPILAHSVRFPLATQRRRLT